MSGERRGQRWSRFGRFTRAVGSTRGVALVVGGCSQGPVRRGRVNGLESVVAQAEKNGAIKCAPRELAIARSQLEFASVDLGQGEMSAARAHLEIAEPNAQ